MSLNKYLILAVVFLALALFYVFKYMYIPERDKAVLYGQKIEVLNGTIKGINNAAMETSKSKSKLKDVERKSEEVGSWASANIPVDISNVLQDAYRRANKN